MKNTKNGMLRKTWGRLRRCGRGVITLLAAVTVLSAVPAADSVSETAPDRMPNRNTLVANVTFVVFDTETTGFSPTVDRIVELGAVKFRNGKVMEERSWLINPGRKIPYWATRVHGIKTADVKDSPSFGAVYPEFETFIEGAILMAHNAQFDISFLSAEIGRIGAELPSNLVIDSLALFRRWYPDAKSHSLEYLTHYTDVDSDRYHRAAADSLYVYRIFDKELKTRDAHIKLRDLYKDCGGPLKF